MTGGLHGGELFILAARPSMGKTALALNMAWHVATRAFEPVAIFSLEMSKESLLTRMLCAAARVDSHRFRTGYLNEQERQKLRQAANQMVESPIFIDDSGALTPTEVRALFDAALGTLRDPEGYAVWQLPVVAGRKPEVA